MERGHDRLEASDNPRKKAIPAEKCASWYPNRVDTVRVIKWKQGKTDTVTGETVYVEADCDSFVKATWDEATKTKLQIKCPPQVIIYRVDTVLDSTTIHAENEARIRALTLHNDALRSDVATANRERDEYKEKVGKWRGRALWTWGILLLLVILVLVWKFFKPKW